MRRADRAGRRAHTAHDLDAFEVAWRGYRDAAQDYRAAAARWEALGGLRPGGLDDFPVAPRWNSNDLATELGPVVIDLSAAGATAGDQAQSDQAPSDQAPATTASADTAPDA
jgi:hypothetical protein